MFSLKKNVSTPMHVNIAIDDDVHMSASNSIVKDYIDEPRRSKRYRVKTSFGPNFLMNFLIEDLDVNFLSNELLSYFFIEEDPKTYKEAMRSIDISL